MTPRRRRILSCSAGLPLTCRVRPERSSRRMSRDGRDVHDLAVPVLSHTRENRLATSDHSHQVHRQGSFPVDLGVTRIDRDSSVVHEDVDAWPVRKDGVERSVDRDLHSDVDITTSVLRSGISSATSRACALGRSPSATCAPCRARTAAIVAPIPRACPIR